MIYWVTVFISPEKKICNSLCRNVCPEESYSLARPTRFIRKTQNSVSIKLKLNLNVYCRFEFYTLLTSEIHPFSEVEYIWLQSV